MHYRRLLSHPPGALHWLLAGLLLALPACKKERPAEAATPTPPPAVRVIEAATPSPTGYGKADQFKPPTSTPVPVVVPVAPAPEPLPAPATDPLPKTEAPAETVVLLRPSQEVTGVENPPLIALPEAPHLNQAGRDLIYEFEIGGGKSYYNKFLRHLEWPGASSGITGGVGYDMGYNSRSVILSDWHMHGAKDRMADVAGITGSRAKAKLPSVRDIAIDWVDAETVYDKITVTKFWQLCQRTYKGFYDLHPNVQSAILSLTFNRGNSLIGERRREMANVAALTALHLKERRPPSDSDYRRIAAEIRKMKRVWTGTDIQKAMYRRREAEAVMVESAIGK